MTVLGLVLFALSIAFSRWLVCSAKYFPPPRAEIQHPSVYCVATSEMFQVFMRFVLPCVCVWLVHLGAIWADGLSFLAVWIHHTGRFGPVLNFFCFGHSPLVMPTLPLFAFELFSFASWGKCLHTFFPNWPGHASLNEFDARTLLLPSLPPFWVNVAFFQNSPNRVLLFRLPPPTSVGQLFRAPFFFLALQYNPSSPGCFPR